MASFERRFAMAENGSIQVLIPTPLRRFTNGQALVSGSGGTVGEMLTELNVRYPGLKERICEEDGHIRQFVNVFVNGENVRERDGAATAVRPGDEVAIIPAMAGGTTAARGERAA
jgi:sulfur-carrier protein